MRSPSPGLVRDKPAEIDDSLSELDDETLIRSMQKTFGLSSLAT